MEKIFIIHSFVLISKNIEISCIKTLNFTNNTHYGKFETF